MEKSSNRCDIFCNVIDNYGDIGVCWRLARQLANEHGLVVRLWVDDMVSFAKLCPEADTALLCQYRHGVEVLRWQQDFPVVVPAELVIESFACKLPQSYIESMAALEPAPVWINLEYLSAEGWVETHHKLPSPHPVLPLTKYFFFPGFTSRTGGLILEHDLLARRDAFLSDATLQKAFWHDMDMDVPDDETLKVSMFAYENAALHGLFDVWSGSTRPVLCLVPEGRILPEVGQYFGDDSPCVNKEYVRDKLRVRVLPFVEQERYDELLWACDVNFVRGEDSCVRAQWAGKPFIWQIYQQHDAVHWGKLHAFLHLYGLSLSQPAILAVDGMWQAWNGAEAADRAWPAFEAVQDELGRHARHWVGQLAENNLALNILAFSREVGKMRAFEIEGQ